MKEIKLPNKTERLQVVISLAYVVNNNCCLLVRRYEPNDPEISNRWELPGGKVEFGEHPCNTAIRELCEETGVIASAYEMLPFAFVAVRRVIQIEINPIILCFRCNLISMPTSIHQFPSKISEAKWIPLSDVKNLNLQDGSRYFINNICL